MSTFIYLVLSDSAEDHTVVCGAYSDKARAERRCTQIVYGQNKFQRWLKRGGPGIYSKHTIYDTNNTAYIKPIRLQ